MESDKKMPRGGNPAKFMISLLGGFRIEDRPGGLLKLTGKKGPAIIAYLALCPGMAAPRERLADLLWSDSDSEHSRNSLRQSLSVLRDDLAQADADILRSHKETIGLRAGLVEVDVERFEAGLSARLAGELDTALALYRGPFLDGFFAGSAFDDWTALERDRLLNRALESFERLARLKDIDTGLTLADRLIAMDPTREASYRLKMDLLAASGQRDRAMRTYEACETMLKKEFGVEASPETRALRKSLLSVTDSAAGSARQQRVNGVAAGQRPGRSVISVAGFEKILRENGATTISSRDWCRTSPWRCPWFATTSCSPAFRPCRRTEQATMPRQTRDGLAPSMS